MCAHVLADVFACVLRSTDISSNVVDISRGFEDLIPSVFEELFAGLLKTLGGKCGSRAGSVPCLEGLTLQHLEQPVVTLPKCDQEIAYTVHCLPF